MEEAERKNDMMGGKEKKSNETHDTTMGRKKNTWADGRHDVRGGGGGGGEFGGRGRGEEVQVGVLNDGHLGCVWGVCVFVCFYFFLGGGGATCVCCVCFIFF